MQSDQVFETSIPKSKVRRVLPHALHLLLLLLARITSLGVPSGDGCPGVIGQEAEHEAEGGEGHGGEGFRVHRLAY